MSRYAEQTTFELFSLALKNENVVFMKYALENGYFTAKLLDEGEVIDMVLGDLEDGVRTEIVFNILTYVDFPKWKQTKLKKFMGQMKEIVKNSFEKNRILLTSNSILMVALACEFLYKIKAVAIFKREAI